MSYFSVDLENSLTGCGFGETPERIKQVVNAIYRLPEGTTSSKPRDYAYEGRIVRKLRHQGFSEREIAAGLKLTRKELGLPSPPRVSVKPSHDRAPRIGPAEFTKKDYELALAKHLDWLYARAQLGDQAAMKALAGAVDRLLKDRQRMKDVGRELVELRSPAANILRVPPEPAAPTPDPPLTWQLPPRAAD